MKKNKIIYLLILFIFLFPVFVFGQEEVIPPPSDWWEEGGGLLLSLPAEYDYLQNCTGGGACTCSGGLECTKVIDCISIAGCQKNCPAPTKANSHLIEGSNSCVVGASQNCACSVGFCVYGRTCTCLISGQCAYACDDGYVFDPLTEECVEGCACSAEILSILSFLQNTIEYNENTTTGAIFYLDKRVSYGDIFFMVIISIVLLYFIVEKIAKFVFKL